MLKIWVKLYNGEKMAKDFIYESCIKYSRNKFEEILREICGMLDIPTPLVLSSHIQHFQNFNQVKFKSSEFVESVNFDMLVLENVPVEEKKAVL